MSEDAAALSKIKVDPNVGAPVSRQLCDQLRAFIVSGELPAGTRLPSGRDFATQLGISRPTVSWAYHQLSAEGYLEVRSGTGTYVNHRIDEKLLRNFNTSTRVGQSQLSGAGELLSELPEFNPEQRLNFIDLSSNIPDLSAFPCDLWRRLLSKHIQKESPAKLSYSFDPRGCSDLREAIAAYLRRARNVICHADQVLVTAGSVQALNLISLIHLEAGSPIAIEEPGYDIAHRVFQLHRASLHPVPVSSNGIDVSFLDGLNYIQPRLLYLTPTHQCPLGYQLLLADRLRVLTWAREHDCLIIEDDYDGEFRYDTGPLPSLQGLAQSDSVIYMGTFSKVVFPALRLSYLVIPKRYRHVYAWAKKLSDNHCPIPEQHAMADFILEGHLERHIHRMRSQYNARRQLAVRSLKEHLNNSVEILGENAGLHITIRLHTRKSPDEILSACKAKGLLLRTTREFYLRQPPAIPEFMICYAGAHNDRLAQGINILVSVINDQKR